MPIYAFIENVSLTVNGCSRMNMGDPLIPILFAFRRVEQLILNKVYFQKASIAALTLVNMTNITITNSSYFPSCDSTFVNALLNSKSRLKSIAINVLDNYTWEGVNKAIVGKIRMFKKLQYLN